MEIVAVVAALVGVVLGDRLAYLRERATRKHEFVRRQVEEFYSPLAGIRHEIRAKSELRVRISSAADAAWRRLCDEVRDEAHELQALSDERFPEFKKIIEYNNQQLAGDLLPSYRKMLDLFREKYWLSNDSTRQHYGALVEFVEVWNRWEKESIPWEVVEELNHSEDPVKPLYQNLESELDRLRGQISKGKA